MTGPQGGYPIASDGPGPNDREPCPSESCRRWHIAHGHGEHDCRVNIPVRSRVERPPLKTGGRRYPRARADDLGGAA